ncbi:E3 ubiquitin-protein ligase KCMF1 [Amphibalanus amphitrite]|uniref:RING-type E3 ubiquitin transferase n=1 Tax=Amphibalanus amphitrite TaxID=1232801 RepID=A0A6A4V5Y3_AMPAM|nr:E3 ubiquitin-protein ligase KCMF1 [Amphibalanus amphitrite]
MPFLVAKTDRGMSRHEGVSCDACLRSNFRGRRYKCLICYDYDLCAGCHEAGSTTTRHTADHPMQCILTRTDAEVLYGGEALPLEQPRSFVCPHCGRMGFTETTLADHVSAQHSDSVTQVVCPVCASVPSGEPNHVTEDLPTHLTVDHHRGGGSGGLSARDLISFGDEPAPAGRQSARRVPHPAQAGGAPRIRRFNTAHFRESMDPITELLSQLSGVRRAATLVSGGPSVGAIGTGTASRLQQLQAQAARQRGDRPARRQPATAGGSADGSTTAAPATEAAAAAAPRRQEAGAAASGAGGAAAADGPQFLLASILDEDDSELAGRQMNRADRSAFVQEVILSTLIDSMDSTSICESSGRPAAAVGAASPAPSSVVTSQPAGQKGRDARPAAAAAAAAGPPARVTPPSAGPPAGAAAAAAGRPAAVSSRLPAARPGRGAPQLRASGLVHHPVGVVAGVRGQRKPPRPAAAAAAVDGRPAEPSAH